MKFINFNIKILKLKEIFVHLLIVYFSITIFNLFMYYFIISSINLVQGSRKLTIKLSALPIFSIPRADLRDLKCDTPFKPN